MPTVDQLLRTISRTHPEIPYWVLEKDYALGYLSAGIAAVDALQEALVVKGGTALRKFYFRDYRFSEDLDFSTRPQAQLPMIDEAMEQAVKAMVRKLQEHGPFQVQMERLLLREPHPGGQDAFIVRVRFPAHPSPQCRLKVEITHDELVVCPPQHRQLLHDYPESITAGMACYPLEEIVAEKLRALLQSRARLQARGWGASRVCRDYYDLWSILKQGELQNDLIPDLVAQKCLHRGVALASHQDFFSEDLLNVARAEWERQLRPFVIDCPDAALVLNELPPMVVDLWS